MASGDLPKQRISRHLGQLLAGVAQLDLFGGITRLTLGLTPTGLVEFAVKEDGIKRAQKARATPSP